MDEIIGGSDAFRTRQTASSELVRTVTSRPPVAHNAEYDQSV
jgi:hypothetical protein